MTERGEFVRHPLIKEKTIEKRAYQTDIAGEALDNSLMVVLPTGLGKTTIALLVIAEKLREEFEKGGDGKVLFLAPTRPLVEQHYSFLRETLDIDPELMVALTGNVPPDRRMCLWKDARVIVSTPQVIENDLIAKRLDLKDVVHITFDECHRAVGSYSYVYIASKYDEHRRSAGEKPLILGMTASPGVDERRIKEICRNLRIEKIESRTELDEDVAPYVFSKHFQWITIDIPKELKEQKRMLEEILMERLEELRKLGLISGKRITKKELIELQRVIQQKLSQQPQHTLYKALSVQAEALKIKHAIELIETQGLSAIRRYYERLRNEAHSRGGSKAARRLLMDKRIIDAMRAAEECDEEHPKLEMLKRIIEKQLMLNKRSRIIVFANFRDTAEMITSALKGVEGIKPVKFVGQASKYKDRGLKQKEQVEIIRKFREGEYNVLVGTSVAEEGLDIPSTDLVVFYEPVPSEIRSIQRKGRTGRRKVGKVVILIAKGTADEAYYWLSRGKERKMQMRMRNMSRSLYEKEDGKRDEGGGKAAEIQTEITDYEYENEEKIKIIVDQRELRSEVVKYLENAGVELIIDNLEVGDYVISDRICVERKSRDDFISSLVEGKRNLLGQIKELTQYEKPLLIIEGKNTLYNRVHPNAIRGALTAISIDFSVPIIRTEDERDTAAFLYMIAWREQRKEKKLPSVHAKKTHMTLKEQQEYIISSIPNVGRAMARSLLRHFGSVEKVMTAPKEELMRVERIGKVTAERIREVVSSRYED